MREGVRRGLGKGFREREWRLGRRERVEEESLGRVGRRGGGGVRWKKVAFMAEGGWGVAGKCLDNCGDFMIYKSGEK